MRRWTYIQIRRLRFKRGVAYGHVTQFRNLGTLYNFRTNQAILFKFGTEMEDVPSKTAVSGRGRGRVTWLNFQILAPL